jgi:hypothetical protein
MTRLLERAITFSLQKQFLSKNKGNSDRQTEPEAEVPKRRFSDLGVEKELLHLMRKTLGIATEIDLRGPLQPFPARISTCCSQS